LAANALFSRVHAATLQCGTPGGRYSAASYSASVAGAGKSARRNRLIINRGEALRGERSGVSATGEIAVTHQTFE